MWQQWRSLARTMLGRRRFEHDMHDELQFHVDACAEDLARQGVPQDEAYRRARRAFGLVGAAEDECRQSKGLRVVDDLRQDLRHAARVLATAPGFTLIAVLILALGIGATTAIFSLANWTLLRPVPGTDDPQDVRIVWSGQWNDRRGFSPVFVSYPNYFDLLPRLKTLSGFAGMQGGSVSLATDRDPGRIIRTNFVTASYFDVLGVQFRVGRGFTSEEAAADGTARVAVISDHLWRSAFDRSADLFRERVRINGVEFTIIGVTARGFRGPERVSSVDLWLPGGTSPIVHHRPLDFTDRGTGGFYEFLARIAPGASWAQVETELASLVPWLVQQHPEVNGRLKPYALHLFSPIGLGGLPTNGGRLRSMLAVMMAASALVLLIVCSNVASLLMMRGVGRRNEVAIRKALGAGRVRLIRQHATEGLLLWLVGGTVGVLFVWLLARLLDVAPLLGMRPVDDQVPIDWRVLTFAAAVSLCIGLAFSLWPAVRAVRTDAGETLRETTQLATGRRATIGAALSAVQLAAALTLLIGTLLLAGSVRHLLEIPLGFNPADVTTFYVDPSSLGYSEAASFAYAREFERRLAATAGVQDVAIARHVPFAVASFTRVRRRGANPNEVHRTLFNEVISPSYFQTLGIPVRRGRGFQSEDIGEPGHSSRRVVVVSENLATLLFGTADPIGQLIEMPVRGRERNAYEVIGVVGTSRFSELLGEPETILYEPAGMDEAFRPSVSFLVRSHAAVTIAPQIRAIATALDRALPVPSIQPLQRGIDSELADWTVLERLMRTLAIVAIGLAAVGLYGVVAFNVAQRRREFGVRVALGATPRNIMHLVLRSMSIVAGAGVLFGLAGALALVRGIESRLVGVDKFEPLLWVIAAAVLLAVVLLASIVPIRRATSGNVTQALRTL